MPARRALRVVALYVALAALWIIGSDFLLGWLVHDPARLTWLQTLKGWFFVATTGLLLFWVLYRQFRADSATFHRHAEQRNDMLALSQFRESIIDNASIWINVLDPAARVTVWNKAAEQISGFRREEVLGTTDIWEHLYPDQEYRSFIGTKVMEILNQGLELEGFETRILCKDGSHKIISWNSRRFFDENGDMGSIAIGLDYTSRKEAEQALMARERQLAILMANVPGMVYRCNHDDRLTMKFVSSGSLALTGYEPESLIDNSEVSWASLLHPEDRDRVRADTRTGIGEGQPFALEYRIVHRDGSVVWVWEQSRAVHSGEEMHLEGIIVNITDRKEMEQNLEQLAVQDPLTGLLNRRELSRRLHGESSRSGRNAQPFSLLWIDIDNFKDVNDELGHLAGDDVLRRVGRLVQDNIRSIDLAARYGGDELGVLLTDMAESEAVAMANRIKRMVEAARILDRTGTEIPVTLSIGVATWPAHGKSADELLDAADSAMYQAKKAGRNRVVSARTAEDKIHSALSRKPEQGSRVS